MYTSARPKKKWYNVGTPRSIKVAAMLLLPMLIAVVACDTSSTSTSPAINPTATTAAQKAAPYANSPEGKPKASLASVPDPVEAKDTKPAGQLPAFLSQETDPKQKAKLTALYQGAMDHYDAYSHVPCYCGCAVYTHPHMSSADCFISSKNANGEMTFTDHSMTCDICQGVAQATLDGLAQNTPLKQIRADIFKKFSYTGIWDDTPPVQ